MHVTFIQPTLRYNIDGRPVPELRSDKLISPCHFESACHQKWCQNGNCAIWLLKTFATQHKHEIWQHSYIRVTIVEYVITSSLVWNHRHFKEARKQQSAECLTRSGIQNFIVSRTINSYWPLGLQGLWLRSLSQLTWDYLTGDTRN